MKSSINNTAIKAGLIVLLAVVVYIPVIEADFVDIDDPLLVTENQKLRNTEGLKTIWLEPRSEPLYCPLVSTAFWIQYHLWGVEPVGYHLVNISLHAASTILLLLILMRLSIPGALLASLIFLIHPLQVESVAWVAELKNILSGFFSLLTVWAFFRFNPPDEKQSAAGPRRYYIIFIFLYLCALLSKATASTIPPVLLLVYWWKRGRFIFRDILYIVPMFVMGVAMAIVAIWVESSQKMSEGMNASNAGSNIAGNTYSLIERFLIAGHAIWFYISKLLWPVNLTCFYTRWKINPAACSQYLYPAAVIAGLVFLWGFRNKIGRGPLAAALIFVGTLAPLSGIIVNSYMWFSFVVDHFQYMASIGLIVLASASGSKLFGTLGQRFERTGKISGAIVVLSLALLSFQQGNLYEHSKILFADNVKKSPDSAVAQYNMGHVVAEEGKVDKAILYYREAVRLWPEYGEARNNLGVTLAAQGKFEEAVPQFYESLKTIPDKAMVHFNLGSAFVRMGKLDEAIVEYNDGLALNPQDAKARYNLGRAYMLKGNPEAAMVAFNRVLDLDPLNVKARYNLGQVYMLKGDLDAAIQQFREALRINPNYTEASNSLKYALTKKNEIKRTR